tara:strand:+ start:199 stop:684 length:486 start_codon:yes stop_codon:yes gene_type:complete
MNNIPEMSANDILLLKKMGINPDNFDNVKRTNVKRTQTQPMPDWWQYEIDRARKHILSVLSSEISNWSIPKHTIETVIDDYDIVGSWRKTRTQLGNCNYTKKSIRINLGYKYSIDGETPQARMYNTLLHEYVHAILYLHYGRSQNHNENFKFYLRLLNGRE